MFRAAPLRPIRILLPAAVLAVVLLLGFVVAAGGLLIATSSTPQPGTGCGTSLNPGAVGADGQVLPSGEGQMADLDDTQRSNAASIITVGQALGVPAKGWLVALATAMQESTLRNIDYGDRDSLGLFQQRPSQGWGTPAQIMDPTYSATIFFERLLQIPAWENLPVTVAAQTVQRSAFPNAYAKWEPLAASLVTTLADTIPAQAAASFTPCTSTPGTPLAEGVVATAIDFAVQQLGKPYLWGGTGPDSFDCSGLLLRAFGAAGINLPRTSREQYFAGQHLPVAEAQPGDLVFLAYDTSDPATIHHVAMYIGAGQVIEAPRSGVPVRVRDFSFNGEDLVPLATRPGT